MLTVDRSAFSWSTSMHVITARAWSRVRAFSTSEPTISVSARLSRSVASCGSSSGAASSPRALAAATSMALAAPESGSTFSSSSSTRQSSHRPRLRMKRSLKRHVTSAKASVRSRECTSIAIVYSCFRLLTVRRSRTTAPPPSTVSTVRARRLGVSASKSWSTHMPNVRPSTRFVSL